MGARQSKRSVDITTTPKKDGLPSDGSVAGDAAAPGDGKLERIEEADSKPTTNGTGPHSEAAEDKDKDSSKEQEKEEDKDKDEDTQKESAKVEGGEQETHTEAPAEAGEVTTPTEETPASPDSVISPDSKDAKKKDKMKKKWSFRSLSFGKRDKSKTARDDAPKNGDITKEEPLAEGGEEAEVAAPAEKSIAEDKTAESSPAATESTEAAPVVEAPAKEEEKAVPVSPKPVEEKKEEPTPAPTPVPVEEKKEEIETVEPVVADKVEVSPVQTISPIGVTQSQPIATPSIIERKTSEDLPPPLPSSPPPTPIDPSPLQRAQHAAANASALAEALKVPAEAEAAAGVKKESTDTTTASSPSPIDSASDKILIAKTPEIVPAATSPEIVEPLETTVKTLPSPSKEIEPVLVAKVTLESEIPVESSLVTDTEESTKMSTPPNDSSSEITSEITPEITSEITPEITSEITPEAKLSREIVTERSETSIEQKTIAASQSTENSQIVAELDSKRIGDDADTLGGESTRIVERGDLVIRSEEGPLPLSEEESLVEAKPAVVIPEDDFVDSVLEAVKTIDLRTPTENSVAEDLIEIVQEKMKYVEIGDTQLLDLTVDAASGERVLKKIDDFLDTDVDSEVSCPISVKELVETTNEPSRGSPDVSDLLPPSPIESFLNSTDEAFPEPPSCPVPTTTKDISDDLPVPSEEISSNLVSTSITISSSSLGKDLSDIDSRTPNRETTSLLSNGNERPLQNGNHVDDEPENDELVASPDRIPSSDTIISPKESFQSQIIDDQSNEEFQVESVSQSLNSYNDSEVQLKERLAESHGLNGLENTSGCPLSNAAPTAVPDKAQILPESEVVPEKPVETATTECVKEAPASPAPPAPVEVPVLPPPEPVITEDVASVTKAIQETDISDKAVAAAVNESIESANTNDIVTDSHYENFNDN